MWLFVLSSLFDMLGRAESLFPPQPEYVRRRFPFFHQSVQADDGQGETAHCRGNRLISSSFSTLAYEQRKIYVKHDNLSLSFVLWVNPQLSAGLCSVYVAGMERRDDGDPVDT